MPQRQIRCLRDPTRGGLSSALNEIAAQSDVSIQIEESKIPVRDEVKGACELLGLDPLYVANEGKLVAIVAPEAADQSVLARCAAIRWAPTRPMIGTVGERRAGIGDHEDGIWVDSNRGFIGGRSVAEDLLRDVDRMHEMGNRQFGARSGSQGVQRYPGARATKVGLRIGEFAGVDRESLKVLLRRSLVKDCYAEFEAAGAGNRDPVVPSEGRRAATSWTRLSELEFEEAVQEVAV